MFIWREVSQYLDIKSLAKLAQTSSFIKGVLEAHDRLYRLYLTTNAQTSILSKESVEQPTKASLLRWEADIKDCKALRGQLLPTREYIGRIFKNVQKFKGVIMKCFEEESRGNRIITGNYVEWFIIEALVHAIYTERKEFKLEGVHNNALSFVGHTENQVLVSLTHHHLFGSAHRYESTMLPEEEFCITDTIINDAFEKCHVPILDILSNMHYLSNNSLILNARGVNRIHKWVIELANMDDANESKEVNRAREEKLIQAIIWAIETGDEWGYNGDLFEYMAVILSAKNKFGPIIRVFNECTPRPVSVNINLILQDVGLKGPEAKEEDAWKWLDYYRLLLWRQTFIINDYKVYWRTLKAKQHDLEAFPHTSDTTDSDESIFCWWRKN